MGKDQGALPLSHARHPGCLWSESVKYRPLHSHSTPAASPLGSRKPLGRPMGITETRGPSKERSERSKTDVLNSLDRVCTSEYMTSSLPARMSPLIRNTTSRYPVDQIEHGTDILTVLASLRFATGGQVQRIIFNRESNTPRQARHRATRAIRRLFDAGYLKRIPVFAPSARSGLLSRQLVHVLSRVGPERWESNHAGCVPEPQRCGKC